MTGSASLKRLDLAHAIHAVRCFHPTSRMQRRGTSAKYSGAMSAPFLQAKATTPIGWQGRPPFTRSRHRKPRFIQSTAR